jgi:single-strand DNA-binding protein
MLNKCLLIGRLGKDPETRYTPQGDAVVTFSMATDESYKNKDGEKTQKTEWHNIVVWRKLAEICGQYLTKGSLIYVEGKIQTRMWEDKEGQKHYKTEIVIDTMRMLGGGSGDDKNSAGKRERQEEAPQQDEDVPF